MIRNLRMRKQVQLNSRDVIIVSGMNSKEMNRVTVQSFCRKKMDYANFINLALVCWLLIGTLEDGLCWVFDYTGVVKLVC